MNIDFRGGPYDGLRLNRADVLRCSTPMLVHTDAGVRLFTLLPQPHDWAAVWAGNAYPAESGLYPYELVLTPGTGCGAEFRDAVEDGGFDRAVADGRLPTIEDLA
jgi:hypothetical protein